ncbi:MAG: hypothetical protein Q7K34_04265 [archaeon]|nr:hypothetical protein [archaeon]
MKQSAVTQANQITAKRILGEITAVFLFFTMLFWLSKEKLLSGFFTLIAIGLISPFIYNKYVKSALNLSVWARILIAIVSIWLAGFFLGIP